MNDFTNMKYWIKNRYDGDGIKNQIMEVSIPRLLRIHPSGSMAVNLVLYTNTKPRQSTPLTTGSQPNLYSPLPTPLKQNPHASVYGAKAQAL